MGRVVQAIVREFQRTPPPLITQHANSINSPTVPIRGTYGNMFPCVDTYKFCLDKNGRSSPNYQLTFPGYKNFSPPTHIPAATPQSFAIPELNLLTLEELQFLNESPDRQDEFLENLPQMREMNKTVDDLMVQIEELAGLLYLLVMRCVVISFIYRCKSIKAGRIRRTKKRYRFTYSGSNKVSL